MGGTPLAKQGKHNMGGTPLAKQGKHNMGGTPLAKLGNNNMGGTPLAKQGKNQIPKHCPQHTRIPNLTTVVPWFLFGHICP
jgi:hypothetical protein